MGVQGEGEVIPFSNHFGDETCGDAAMERCIEDRVKGAGCAPFVGDCGTVLPQGGRMPCIRLVFIFPQKFTPIDHTQLTLKACKDMPRESSDIEEG